MRSHAHDTDFELAAQMRNVVPGAAIDGAVVINVTNVHLVPHPNEVRTIR